MKLKEYLDSRGIKSTWFAKQIPCSTSYFSALKKENYLPSVIISNRIEELTDGHVKREDFNDTGKVEKSELSNELQLFCINCRIELDDKNHRRGKTGAQCQTCEANM